MTKLLKLPVGIENFQEIRRLGFYYVDKTKLIEQLLDHWAKVNLFTRPRRFGKTLNMSMLRCFFEIGMDPALFDGLYISENRTLFETYMGQFPVIMLSLKGVDGLTFERAKEQLAQLIGTEAERFCFLSDSDRLSKNEKNKYAALTALCDGQYVMHENVMTNALHTLSMLLCKHYGKQTIVLIDEYDVPLDQAFRNGYYEEMAALIRDLFGQVLKTNDFLQFAVLTGCLRVSKESIFTGLNNFKICSITDTRFDEQFGFTESEVENLLAAYRLESHLNEIKTWYDGYLFGKTDIYCPWDVINHVDTLLDDEMAVPQAYWINTSSNALVRRFIEKADQTTRDEIESLIAGDIIEKQIRQDLTYNELDNTIDHLWSVLLTTGYLTPVEKMWNDRLKLKIPNEEIRKVFEYQIKEWFTATVLKNADWLPDFWQAFETGHAKIIEDQLTAILGQSISFYDIKKEEPENAYHTFLLGILAGNAAWGIASNREAGEGRADLLIKTADPDAGIVIELKKAGSFSELDQKCREAVEQIHRCCYAEALKHDGRHKIWAYGIAFYKKRCKVISEKLFDTENR